jgi:hypothetical protein
MRLMGKFTPNTHFKGISYFIVTVLDQCYLTKIIKSKLPSEIVYVMTSPIQNPYVLRFDPWYDTLGKCGDINYKINLIDGSAAPSFIDFNSNIRQISI